MELHFVYILKCSDDAFYIGQTTDIEESLREHRSRKNVYCYTARRLPVSLVYFKEFVCPDEASAFEMQIKKWSRIKKQALIEGGFEAVKRLPKKAFGRKIAQPSVSL
jgi:putative endonuclease